MSIPPCKVFFTRMKTDKGSVKILEQKARFCQVVLEKKYKYTEETIKRIKVAYNLALKIANMKGGKM